MKILTFGEILWDIFPHDAVIGGAPLNFAAHTVRCGAEGYILSALVFCAIHVISYIGSADPLTLVLCFVQYLPASLCLAWAYTEADNIFAPILIHIAVNTMSILAL